MNIMLPEPLLQFLTVGGPVVWIHLAMSFVLLTIVLLKLWQFAAAGMFSARARRRAERIVANWEKGDAQNALAEARSAHDPQTGLLHSAIEHLHQHTLQGKALGAELGRQAAQTMASLRANLHTVELIAGLAPLLGLLGTVLGMIEAFQAMEAAGRQVDPSTLSGGIWQALLTTAVGLIVAMPAIVAHNWMSGRIERFATHTDDRLQRVLTAAECQRQPTPVARTELSRVRA